MPAFCLSLMNELTASGVCLLQLSAILNLYPWTGLRVRGVGNVPMKDGQKSML